MYLRHQKKQLDESKRLLTKFESHTASVVITQGTGESGTVGPVLVTSGHGSASVQQTASAGVAKGTGASGTVGPVSIAHSHGTASVSVYIRAHMKAPHTHAHLPSCISSSMYPFPSRFVFII